MFIGTFFFHIMLETYGAYPFLIMMMILNILFYTEHIHEHNHIYIYILFFYYVMIIVLFCCGNW